MTVSKEQIYKMVRYALFYLEAPDIPGKKELLEATCRKNGVHPDLIMSAVQDSLDKIDYNIHLGSYLDRT